MTERPFYVELAEALEKARKEGSAVLVWSGVIINLTRDDSQTTSLPEDSPPL